MKKTIPLSLLTLAMIWVVSSCSDDRIAPKSEEGSGSAAFVGESCGCPDVAVRPIKVIGQAGGGDFISSNRLFVCDTTYALKGRIYVEDQATLSIEPGTIVLGNSPQDRINDRDLIGMLIIERTGAIQAVELAFALSL